jgi:elongation factor G
MIDPRATPVLSVALRATSDADRERLDEGLRHLTDEDPTLCVDADPRTGEVIIAAVGEVQLDIVVHRLGYEFHVDAAVGRVGVAYREALTTAASGEGRFAGQPPGCGQYGHAKVRVFPGEPGSGFAFADALIPGAIPYQFVEPVRRGIEEASRRGVLAGYPIQDVRVELFDGTYHDVDSSEAAFEIAGAMAFEDAAKKATPVLLEPVMHAEIVAPADNVSDVIADLSSRRGRIQSREDRAGVQIVRALVPMSEMLGYAADLRSHSRGRATYSLHFDHYEAVRDDPDRGDGRDSLVGAPLRPAPRLNDSAVALPEPDDDCLDTDPPRRTW